MVRWFLLFMIVSALLMSVAMAFFPERVLGYVRRSRVWGWYLRAVFGFTTEMLNGKWAVKWVRVQGAIGLVVALIAQWVWFTNPTLNL